MKLIEKKHWAVNKVAFQFAVYLFVQTHDVMIALSSCLAVNDT